LARFFLAGTIPQIDEDLHQEPLPSSKPIGIRSIPGRPAENANKPNVTEHPSLLTSSVIHLMLL
jgi:hypothetical protein